MNNAAYPFHRIAWCNLPELHIIAKDSNVRCVRQFWVVRRRAEVKLPGRLRDDVQPSNGRS